MSNVRRIYKLADDDEYPYVAHMASLPREFDVQWLEDRAMACSKIGRIFFFKREEDRTIFLMVWAKGDTQ